jgi:hypothetical protein
MPRYSLVRDKDGAGDSQYKCRTFPVSVAIKDHFGLD